MTIKDLIDISHNNAREKGFWDKERNVGEMIALCHSELSEALEGHRHGDEKNFAEELADTVIRIGDLCGGLRIDLEEAIRKKFEINAKRAYLHGKSY